MTGPCCTPLVTGSGNAPGGLIVNMVCGDPVNLSYRQCGGWPADLDAILSMSHPWGWDMTVTGTVSVDGEWLQFHISAEDAMTIPRDSSARIKLAYPGVEQYTWIAGHVAHRGGC